MTEPANDNSSAASSKSGSTRPGTPTPLPSIPEVTWRNRFTAKYRVLKNDLRSKEIRYTVGNLKYTRRSLYILFAWLLWGDFCFVLFEHVIQPVLALKLRRELHMNDMTFPLVMASLPAIVTLFLVPTISMKSDRHRGPRGRRIPFLLYATPFVCLAMIALGFMDDIGTAVFPWVQNFLRAILPAIRVFSSDFDPNSHNTVLIVVIAALFFLFTIPNMFLQSVWWYLCNDVVPREIITRFMAAWRIIGVLAQMLFGFLLYQFLEDKGSFDLNLGLFTWHYSGYYYRLVLVGLAAFFLIAFSLACLHIKEPQYPPPPQNPGKRRGVIANMRTLFTECFTHKIYWILFITLTLDQMSTCTGIWQLPLWRSLGITMKTLGYLSGIMSIASIIVLYLAGGLGDKIKPLPLMIIAGIGMVVTAPIGFLYLIPGLSVTSYLAIRVVYIVTHMPINAVSGIANQPMHYQLLPRERYGQFAAAGAMMRAIVATILGHILAGQFLALMQRIHGGGDYNLRYVHVWSAFFQILALGGLFWLYHEWKKLGGKHSYTPPVTWKRETATN